MKLLESTIPQQNKVVQQYLMNKENSFFHYHYANDQADDDRLRELSGREFLRKELSDHIRTYMEQFPLTKEIDTSLQKLADDRSVVVIGGQQAGLLTGPLYTIHKIISIVLFAREKEAKLQVPVVPIFWIAGEDHDLDEVNHVYTVKDNKLVKNTYKSTKPTYKAMISNTPIEHSAMKEWYEKIIRSFGETIVTKDILHLLNEANEHSRTFTEFFAYLIHALFKSTGLLILDAAHPALRRIEKDYFQLLIKNGKQINETLINNQQKLINEGYQKMITTVDTCFHLFYEHEGERILLQYDDDTGEIYGKNIRFSVEEIMELAKTKPEKLSNNVVSRPIMQELLFPTLAFIAGPGEIAYWAELKDSFETVGLKMPLIVPRINISILERQIEKDIDAIGIPIEAILTSGIQQEKEKWLQEFTNNDQLAVKIVKGRQKIRETFNEIANDMIAFDKSLEQVVSKNEEKIIDQLNYLQKKVEDSLLLRNQVLLQKFDRIETALYPLRSFQERCWNIFYFINRYGFDFIDLLLNQPYRFNGNHYIVKI